MFDINVSETNSQRFYASRLYQFVYRLPDSIQLQTKSINLQINCLKFQPIIIIDKTHSIEIDATLYCHCDKCIYINPGR